MKIPFKVSNKELSWDDSYISSEHSLKNVKYSNIFLKEIKNSMGFSSTTDFIRFVNENNFRLLKVLALRKGTPKIDNYINPRPGKKPRSPENITMILHSSEKLKYNSITITYDLQKESKDSKSLDAMKMYIKRVGFFNYNFSENPYYLHSDCVELVEGHSVLVDQILCSYEPIFNDEDYKQNQSDIKFNEWFSFIDILSDKILNRDKEEQKMDNFIFEHYNKNILFSKHQLNLSNLYNFNLYDINIGQNIKEKISFSISDYDKKPSEFILNNIEVLEQKINEANTSIERSRIKIKEINNSIDEINERKHILENDYDFVSSIEKFINQKYNKYKKLLELLRKNSNNKKNDEKTSKQIEKEIDEYYDVDLEYDFSYSDTQQNDYSSRFNDIHVELDFDNSNYEHEEDKIYDLNSDFVQSTREIIDYLENNYISIDFDLDEINSLFQEIDISNNGFKNDSLIQGIIKSFEKSISLYEKEKTILLTSLANKKNEINKLEKLIKEDESQLKNFTNQKNRLKDFSDFLNENKFIYAYEVNNIKINTSEDDNKNEVKFWKLFDYQINKCSRELLTSNTLVSSRDGTLQIIKRYSRALRRVINGYYKNPLFFLSIKDPNGYYFPHFNDININEKLDHNVQNKYKLNKKQLSAVEKAINANATFSLQGPPGTGKTQTICAISEHIVSKKMNLIISSSTHEAINNFFDRIDDLNPNNPNLILLKYRYKNTNNEDKMEDEIKFSNINLFRNFKNKMMNNFIVSKNDSKLKNELIKKLEDYKNHYGSVKKPNEYLTMLPETITKLVFDNFNNTYLKNNLYDYHEEKYYEPIRYDTEMTNGILKRYEKLKHENEQLQKFDDILDFIVQNSHDLEINIFDIDYKDELFLEKIYKSLTSNNSSNSSDGNLDFKSKMKNHLTAIKNEYQNNESCFDIHEKDFIKFIIDNRLINVIGITTTSRNEVEVGDQVIDLYSDYPIDYMIIDEISKCSTPEILTKAVLVKKVIFAGDYLQLPPQPNLTEDFILNKLVDSNIKSIFENLSDFDEYDDDYLDLSNNEEIDEDDLLTIDEKNRKNKIDKLKNEIEDLYKKSFFSSLVTNISKNTQSTENSAYEFLNISHRFRHKEILDIVNHVYPTREKLKMPSVEPVTTDKQEYSFTINNKSNLTHPVVLVNILNPDNEFKLLHGLERIVFTKKGFDQSGEGFKYNGVSINIKADSSYNQYSAYITVKLVHSLLSENKSKINNKKRIGIITLTKTQKTVVNKYIKLMNVPREYVKVDTIDNFQGREEEIIIVDFIRGEQKITNGLLKDTKSRNLDFLTAKERINVALSRCKNKLIILGHFDYLKGDDVRSRIELFNRYYHDLKDSDSSYIEVGER